MMLDPLRLCASLLRQTAMLMFFLAIALGDLLSFRLLALTYSMKRHEF